MFWPVLVVGLQGLMAQLSAMLNYLSHLELTHSAVHFLTLKKDGWGTGRLRSQAEVPLYESILKTWMAYLPGRLDNCVSCVIWLGSTSRSEVLNIFVTCEFQDHTFPSRLEGDNGEQFTEAPCCKVLIPLMTSSLVWRVFSDLTGAEA